jgi:predicted enzyme related to lactoylglutathione lyase
MPAFTGGCVVTDDVPRLMSFYRDVLGMSVPKVPMTYSRGRRSA